jgi:hypothetical protein
MYSEFCELPERESKCTSANEHIGSMAALPPLEKAVRIERLSPAGKVVEAATTQSCKIINKKLNFKLT